MKSRSVTFETKCYEKDWEVLLKSGRLENMIGRNQYDFAERVLYINNVANPDKVRMHAERLKERGVLTGHVLVEEHVDAALSFFGLDRDCFQGGYYYSIQELVGIYLCRSDYLLHFSGDAILEKPFGWIGGAIDRMEETPRIKAGTCLWNGKTNEAEAAASDKDEDFWLLGYGFSDQCYLIKIEDFRARIFSEQNPASEVYPSYGGELFEKRVDAWMRNNDYLRLVYKHGSYLHKNYDRNPLLRMAKRFLGFYDR